MEIQIKKMKKADLSLINLDEFDDFWSLDMLKEELMCTSSFYIIAIFETNIVGFAGMNIVLDEAHLSNIVVKKHMRNLHIGEKLLSFLINEAQKTCTSLTLEVNEQNLPAIHLYKKFNFKILGKRKKYYYNKYDALIMTKYF